MPYLRISCPPVTAEGRREIAAALTDAVVELFTPPRGPTSAETRQHTTVQFTSYADDELFIGAVATRPDDPDITVELSDWYMSGPQRRRVAAALTPLLVRLFASRPDSTNIRFHSYPPSALAVGGRLLSDRIPSIARLAKHLAR